MSSLDLEKLKENVLKDIEQANNSDIKKIYKELNNCLMEFDRDNHWKNFFDSIKVVFSVKRNKCKLIILDICDSSEKLNRDEKQELKHHLLEIQNIHRTFIENLIALIGAL